MKKKGFHKGRNLTYEYCKEVCSHFNTITQVWKQDQAVARKCHDMGWILNFFPNKKQGNNGRHLTYDYCKKVCSQYKNPTELRKHDSAVHAKCYKTGWIYEFYPDMKRIERILNYNTCQESAKRFKTRMEFREGDESAYSKSVKEGWINDFGLYSPGSEKYTEAAIIEVAKKFTTHRDFRLFDKKMYDSAKHRGILDKCVWLEKAYNKGQQPIYSLYVYEFTATHAVYVGITVNKKARHIDHLSKYDSVAIYANQISEPVPKPLYLKNGMSRQEAQVAEKNMIAKYRNEGWFMINKAPGGSVGSLGSDYWTKDKCIKTARQYRFISDLVADFRGCWVKMRKNGWDKECPWLKRKCMRPGVWNSITKKDAHQLAKKCKNRTEFNKKYRILYPIAKKMGWVDEWFPAKFAYCTHSKEVIAYNPDGVTEIGRYKSIAEATRAFGGRKGNINNCCNGKTKMAYGKIFRFANNAETIKFES